MTNLDIKDTVRDSWLLASILVLVALVERLVFDLGPNVELVTMASVVAGVYLPVRFRLVVPLVIMAVSDWVLGFGIISLFTWSGFGVMALLPGLLRSRVGSRFWLGLGSGLIGNIIFFWWTNFGVWLTESYGMYSNDLTGLMRAYVMGLPFLKLQMMSTVIFVPAGLVGVEFLAGKLGFGIGVKRMGYVE